ncbi:unnamed protein product [Spodoptera exigua]|nr:unnamed protein product [Spodoptera exigua]
MKISVLITTVLIVQVSSTSFFDLFHGAVQSVQTGFGKLLTDVVTDVKETVDCTILAVQQMLSLNEDATRRYFEKCGNGMNSTSTDVNSTNVEGDQPVNEENLEKEIDEKINKTVSKVFVDYKPDEKIKELEKLLVKESEQLADVNDLLKKEIKKLSEEVDKDFKKVKHDDTESSVETILHEIKVLEKEEQNTRNTSEAQEIHHVMSEVLEKIDAIESTEATENVKLDEIVRDLQNKSKDNSIILLKQEIKEWKEEESRNLGELMKEVEEHEKIFVRPKIEPECNHTEPVIFNIAVPKDPTASFLNSQETSSENMTKAIVIDESASINKSIISLNGSQRSNETIQLDELTKPINPETKPLTITNSTIENTTIIHENIFKDAVRADNVNVSISSAKDKPTGYMANNDTVIVREMQRTNVELTSSTQGIIYSGNINNTETTSSSTTMDAMSTEKVLTLAVPSNVTATSEKIDTHLTSVPVFLYEDFIFANKSIQPEEITTTRTEEITASTTKPTIIPDQSLYSTPISEINSHQLLNTTENNDNTSVTTKPNEVHPNLHITNSSPDNEDNPLFTTKMYNPMASNMTFTNSPHDSNTTTPEEISSPGIDDTTITTELNYLTNNIQVRDSSPGNENIRLEKLTTVGYADNSTLTTEPNATLPEDFSTTDSLLVSGNILAEEFTRAVSDNSPEYLQNTEPNESVTSMVESAYTSESTPHVELTTANNDDFSTTEPNYSVNSTQSITDSSSATENITLEELATYGKEDSATVTTELYDTVTPDMTVIDSSPTSEIAVSEVTSAITDDKESIPTTTDVTDSTAAAQDGSNITNASNSHEEEITPCCKDYEEVLNRLTSENTTRITTSENTPSETPMPAIDVTTETLGKTLTTQIPTLRAGLIDSKNISFDYDSFFPSQTNKEVRVRAIKEARQLMRGRKRSERIINNILKNKRKGAVSLFSRPIPINSGSKNGAFVLSMSKSPI